MVGRGTHRYLKLGHSQIQLSRTPAMDTTHESTAAPVRNKPTYDQTIPIGQCEPPSVRYRSSWEGAVAPAAAKCRYFSRSAGFSALAAFAR